MLDEIMAKAKLFKNEIKKLFLSDIINLVLRNFEYNYKVSHSRRFF